MPTAIESGTAGPGAGEASVSCTAPGALPRRTASRFSASARPAVKVGIFARVCSRVERACSTSRDVARPACARQSVSWRVSDWLARFLSAMASFSW
jgi:hypothetical protein